MNAINFLRVLVVVILLLCMKTSSSESESLFKYGKMMIRCIAEEREALLLFKKGVANKHDYLQSWKKEEEDCCHWEGVGCDNRTGHVTQLHLSFLVSPISYIATSFSIGSSLLDLPYLNYLDLSGNNLTEIPEFIGSLTKLAHLDLSNTYIGGSISYQIGNLSNLQYLNIRRSHINSSIPKSIGSLNSLTYLDLSDNQLYGAIPQELGNLSKLRHLDLGYNYMNSSIPKSIGSLNSLTYLDLSFNQLFGVIPHELGNLSKLHYLDLSYSNSDLTAGLAGNLELSSLSSLTYIDLSFININAPLSIIWSSFIHRIPSMKVINLHDCNLTGSFPESFGNMTSLTHLDLSANQLNGVLPQFILNSSNLEAIDFSENNFQGLLPDIGQISALLELDLSNNHLSGSLPAFTGFSSLIYLLLNNNAFSGSIPDFSGCSLQELELGNNKLTEWKSQSTGLLSSLWYLDVSMNFIRNTITETHLSNLSSLYYLNTSFNPLNFELNSEWLPPFQLTALSLASCKLGPKFPSWIRNQSNLDVLDISNTQISDTIPLWFWNISINMWMLNLSSNNIRGKFSPKYDYIQVLDLSSNYFDGPLPAIPSKSLQIINLSQNKFSGTLFSLSVGEDVSLSFLDISHNQLVGAIPDYWMHFQDLVFLNFGYNNLTGSIPKSIGHLAYLETLILRNNKLYGELPIALRNCSSLRFIDFGLNKLSGKVPSWIGKDLPNLYALILKSNRFYEKVPHEICLLSNLHFLDLSINKISGNIPPCFNNLTAMIQKGTEVTEHSYCGHDNENVSYLLPPKSSYYDMAVARWKGQEFEYGRNFAFLKMIDLSTNELTGEIPIEITRLVDLKGLNLSGNRFYGKVPSEIGLLKELECLDLSTNQFSGKIPASMTGLYFLSYLDLSSNNFTGRIPSGTQLQGFNISTYEGNTGLCGKPLTNICPGDEPADHIWPSSREDGDGDDNTEYDRWFYVSLVVGFSTTFWGIIGTLVLNRRWRHAYFLFLDNLKERLFVVMAVRIARLKRHI